MIYECELMDGAKNLTIVSKEMAIERLGVPAEPSPESLQ